MTKDTVACALLRDGFSRVMEGTGDLLASAGTELLSFRPTPGTNHIGWLIWHLTRVQDDHLVHLADNLWPGDPMEQCWIAEGWQSGFGLPYGVLDTGYGHSRGQVDAFGMFDAGRLLGYCRSVHGLTETVLDRLEAGDFEVVVDRRWDPPVTAGVRLVSVLSETTKHLGQAELIKGMFAGQR
ncbi:mycothiol transferase [Paeniglutamicibacter sp. R2-26]|uniref:mycothiol transferase n=1 Tax=Paeniglutamicibacter sp. R2-26 TaxID=3144417 RepID=UPI003EE75E10